MNGGKKLRITMKNDGMIFSLKMDKNDPDQTKKKRTIKRNNEYKLEISLEREIFVAKWT